MLERLQKSQGSIFLDHIFLESQRQTLDIRRGCYTGDTIRKADLEGGAEAAAIVGLHADHHNVGLHGLQGQGTTLTRLV